MRRTHRVLTVFALGLILLGNLVSENLPPRPALREGEVGSESPLAKKKQLMTLYHELGVKVEAARIAREILKTNPSTTEARSILGSQFLERRDPEGLRDLVADWQSTDPESKEARYFEVAGWMMEEDYTRALEIQEREVQRCGGISNYPYLEDLGVAAAADGNLPLAIEAYRTLLDRADLAEDSRGAIRRNLDDWYRGYLPRFEHQMSFLDLESGTVVENELSGSVPIGARQRLLFVTNRRDLMINAGGGLRSRTESVHEGMTGWQTIWSQDWRTWIWAGGGERGAKGGGEVEHRPVRWFRQKLEIFGNESAEDSLAFEMVGGRQDRIGHRSDWSLTRNDTVSMDWNLRKLRVADQTYGESWNGSWRYERLAMTVPLEIRFGYLGSYQGVHHRNTGSGAGGDLGLEGAGIADQELLMRGLVSDQLHREGLFARLPIEMIPQQLSAELGMRSEYDLMETVWIYSGSAELRCWMSKFFELRLGMEYSTGSSGSNQSSDSILMRTGMLVYF